jgi:hypothetical protein
MHPHPDEGQRLEVRGLKFWFAILKASFNAFATNLLPYLHMKCEICCLPTIDAEIFNLDII